MNLFFLEKNPTINATPTQVENLKREFKENPVNDNLFNEILIEVLKCLQDSLERFKKSELFKQTFH